MDEFDVDVDGGRLRVCRWPGDGPVVLAAHGITANALSFAALAEALAGRVELVAPDLRGRARSSGLPGPYGMAAHAADLIAVADHLGLQRVALAGHSMGGFVVAATAAGHPGRVTGVLLIDGGVGLTVPPAADINEVLLAVIGPAMRRLDMTFADEQAYLDFFRAHPALRDGWSPAVAAYVRRDLAGTPPHLRSSCAIEAVRADATDTLIDRVTVEAVHRLPAPARLMWAERGLQNEKPGLYDESRLAAAGLDPARIAVEHVPGVNHYSILFDPRAAAVVADRLVELATGP
ncbi:alpha/beta fold hydrolase [Paractinoplanes hotanensis]|uniref:Alpha/beta hydrolase n=1 Tax=Paractinoplanes hotanensis TaxID=2906497 RepID=A0ABT0XVR6_9ACTN|nr:alpha/beta hydrolase [Actinoplanes hotanensis]MCM4077891.1 alpha/beta hydrolase [Actinoplanes hotanensis]